MELHPNNFKMEKTSIWSFPTRGKWCTHNGNYRGNFSPYIPRNLILKYSNPNDWILDQFCGSGTTLIEAKLLDRNSIGIDINPYAIKICKNNLDFSCENNSKHYLLQCSAEKLEKVNSDSISLICTHPPYSGIIHYSKGIIGDLSLLELDSFMHSMGNVAAESFRVLKPKGYCCFLIGDIRKNGSIFPLGFKLMNIFIDKGLRLKEIIIKEQHNCKSTSYWNEKISSTDYYLLAHEYLFIFQK